MRKAVKLDNILNESVERLLRGESIEECIGTYPERAAELKPLLETALLARRASAVQPRPEFREKARNQFWAALQVPPTRKALFTFGWPRWATAVAIFLGLLLAGGSTVAVANNSLPGEALYHVKLATEQVWLAFTSSKTGKAELYAKFADRRVAEIVSIADRGNPEVLEETTSRLELELAMIVSLMGGPNAGAGSARMEMAEESPALAPPAPTDKANDAGSYAQDSTWDDDSMSTLWKKLERYAESNPEVLRELLDTAPESVRSTLLEAISVAEDGYQRALEAVANPDR